MFFSINDRNKMSTETKQKVDWTKRRIDGQLRNESRGRILGRNPDKSLKSFHPCHSQAPHTALPWDFYFFKFTQPLTVSRVHTVKEKRGKPDRKPYFLCYSLRKSILKPQVWDLKIMPRNLNELVRSWIPHTRLFAAFY